MSRFSKTAMIAALDDKADSLQKQFGFNPDNGTAQLKGRLDSQDAAIAYGQYRLCRDLAEQIHDGSLFR